MSKKNNMRGSITITPVFQEPSGRKPGVRRYEPVTGNYLADRPVNCIDSVMLGVPPPPGAGITTSKEAVIHPVDSRQYSTQVDADLRLLTTDRIIDGKAFESKYVVDKLQEWGYDAKTALREPVGRRIRLARKLLRAVHQLKAEQNRSPFEKSDGPVKSIPTLHTQALRRWATTGTMRLEKPQGSSMHHLAAFHREYYPTKGLTFEGYEDFVVEHDWHAAFADKSKDFLGGEWRLPYDECAFEFRIENVRVIAFFQQHSDCVKCPCVALGIHREWHVIPQRYLITSNDVVHPIMDPGEDGYSTIWNRPFDFIVTQVRAVCIMLDARVAEAETREAPRELREHRVKMGRTAQNDYRVVSLIRKTRTHRPGVDAGPPSGRHVKFHWRRGHWRHIRSVGGQVPYIDAEGITRSKTWINWMPVGDPDLGFVDKEYRL